MTLTERLDTQCEDTFRGERCEMPAAHPERFHHAGEHTWGFQNPMPEWRARAIAQRDAYGLVAVKELSK